MQCEFHYVTLIIRYVTLSLQCELAFRFKVRITVTIKESNTVFCLFPPYIPLPCFRKLLMLMRCVYQLASVLNRNILLMQVSLYLSTCDRRLLYCRSSRLRGLRIIAFGHRSLLLLVLYGLLGHTTLDTTPHCLVDIWNVHNHLCSAWPACTLV